MSSHGRGRAQQARRRRARDRHDAARHPRARDRVRHARQPRAAPALERRHAQAVGADRRAISSRATTRSSRRSASLADSSDRRAGDPERAVAPRRDRGAPPSVTWRQSTKPVKAASQTAGVAKSASRSRDARASQAAWRRRDRRRSHGRIVAAERLRCVAICAERRSASNDAAMIASAAPPRRQGRRARASSAVATAQKRLMMHDAALRRRRCCLVMGKLAFLARVRRARAARDDRRRRCPPRGDIVDRNGAPLARTIDAWAIGGASRPAARRPGRDIAQRLAGLIPEHRRRARSTR